MKNILKKNQVVILVVSLLLITAGYLNYTDHANITVSSTVADRNDDKIGDAELVSTTIQDEEIEETEETVKTEELNKSSIDALETAAKTEEDNSEYFFENSKLQRSSMYSELLESYQEIYNNVNTTNEEKKDAYEKINKINNTKNSIMIAENLIIAKGFENLVIFANDDSISVIVKAKELGEDKVAQIQNIISRELKVDAEKIHISNK